MKFDKESYMKSIKESQIKSQNIIKSNEEYGINISPLLEEIKNSKNILRTEKLEEIRRQILLLKNSEESIFSMINNVNKVGIYLTIHFKFEFGDEFIEKINNLLPDFICTEKNYYRTDFEYEDICDESDTYHSSLDYEYKFSKELI